MTNNRKHQRFLYDADIKLETDGEKQVGRAINISGGGILLSTDSALAFGTKVMLHLKLPRIPEVCEISCIVRWTGEKNRVGLQFESLRAKEVWGLSRLMHTLEPVEPN